MLSPRLSSLWLGLALSPLLLARGASAQTEAPEQRAPFATFDTPPEEPPPPSPVAPEEPPAATQPARPADLAPPPEDPSAMPRSPQPQPAALEEEERPDPFAEGPRRGEPEPRPAAAPDSNDSKDSAKGFEMPPWSVRVDPLNWLLEGRFGLELEAGVWKILSVEVVPAFITNEQPPTLDLSSFPDVLHQKSNGLGALAGVSTSVGIWLSGKPFDGFVLRPFYSVLALRYESRDAGVQIDATDRTEHFLGLMLGSEDKWGAFTIGYSFGLAKNLNDQRRCFTTVNSAPSSNCNDDVQELVLSRDPTDPRSVDLNGSLHPYYLVGRLSLGVAFD